MLISEKTSKDLDILYSQFFNLNSLFDNACSFMLNEWAMVKASDIIHHNLAHIFPIFADMVSEIKDDYDMRSVRLEVPAHTENYGNLKDMTANLLNECALLYQMIKLAYTTSVNEGDFNVQVGLIDIMKKYNKILGQVITLDNKAQQLGENYDMFDAHIENWGIVGLGA